MSQLKFYKYVTWALLFLNIVVLAFFLLTKSGPPHRSSSNNFQAEVIEILDLDSQQVVTFKKLASEHHQKIKSIERQQQRLLPSYFERLSDPSGTIDKTDLLNQIQQLEGEKIEVTYQHFQDIKIMLNKNQLPHFEQLMGRFIDNLLLIKKNPRRSKDFN